MKLTLEAEPLRRGWPGMFELRVVNEGETPLLLEEARWDPPCAGVHAWTQRPLGLLRYDAAADRYHYRQTASGRCVLPLWVGLLEPGAAAGCLLPTRSLAASDHAATLRVSSYRLSERDLAERIYSAPAKALNTPQVSFAPWEVGLERAHLLVARLHGLERQVEEHTYQLEVQEDGQTPAEAALEAVPSGELVGRCRRLGGAWVVRSGEDDALHLVRGEEHLRCPPGSLGLDLVERLDDDLPFQPIPVLLRSRAAEALARSGQVELEGVGQAQQLLRSEALWGLLAALPAAGVRLTWGRHADIQDGLVIR